jgi:ABC-2 type transport system permease protein
MTNSAIKRIAQKETRLFFASPVAWLFLSGFAIVTLFIFFWGESFFARNIADVRPLFEWMPVLLVFLCSAITMRSWSEERRSGTLEHVITQPVALWRFVLGKFRACFFLLMLALATTLPLPITVSLLGDLDWGPVIAGYLATALLGATYLSVGLYVSARTDNPIVSLMIAVALCGGLYLVGSPQITGFFSDNTAAAMRLLGSGAHFGSITRGVIDLRDLFYYCSGILIFLSMNVYALERERWARTAPTHRHLQWRSFFSLLILNLIIANIWLAKVSAIRIDVTRGNLYSISTPTHALLGQLEEPLLIRGYFSAKTHPLLSPLVPQLRDILQEYAIAGGDRVRVEFVDPVEQPALEQEANEQYKIFATPFQVADRYQSALVNSYFNILVKYGDQYETLGFADLIEIRTAANESPDVLLRNPEFDITRAIKSVLYSYQASGNIFEGIEQPVKLTAYVSRDALLPELLVAYKSAIKPELEAMKELAGDKFSFEFIEPEAGDGSVAQQIADEWNFKPMITALGDDIEFYFYLTLSDDRQVVQIPTDKFNTVEFADALQAGLKRFASGFTKTVAFSAPELIEQQARFRLGAPTFTNLERLITRDYTMRMEDLEDGFVDTAADVLAVAAPRQLSDRAIFAIDQYLMRGGTVLLATSPYSAEIAGGEIKLLPWQSGLEGWLADKGISIDKSLVLDRRNTTFPAPVKRSSGGYDFRDVQLVDYPYFIDIREEGINTEHPITRSLPQVTMAWASPIDVDRSRGLTVTTLLRSSEQSWRSTETDVMPRVDNGNGGGFVVTGSPGQEELVVNIQGRFDSYFRDREVPAQLNSSAMLNRSPDSARIILFASNDFMDDQVLQLVVNAAGNQYLGGLEIFTNALDWAVEEDDLLQIRSRAHFNRTLRPMDESAQAPIEYLNYGLALSWLGFLGLWHWLRGRLRRRRYRLELGL